ncbi:MAG: hypothetical protein OEZ34_17510, partial [Spirochaetia bacterium]|nr:hypothetical protein [Spirochaetia bacterium]
GKIDDVDEAFVNGVSIGKTGKPYPERDPRPDKTRIYLIPSGILHHGVNVLAVRVVDTGGEGGIKGEIPYLGEYRDLILSHTISELYTFLFSIVFFFSGLFSIIFYLQMRRNIEHLFFFLLTLDMSVAIMNYSELRFFLVDDFFFWNTIQILSGFFMGPLFILFLYHFFRIRIHSYIYYYLYYSFFLSFSLILNLVLKSLEWIGDNEFHDMLVFVFWIPSLLYPLTEITMVFIRQAKRRHKEAFILIGTSVIFIIASLNDISLFFFERVSAVWLLKYGFFIFILGMVYSLSSKYSRFQRALLEFRKDSPRQSEDAYTNKSVRINCLGSFEVFDEGGLIISEELVSKRKRLTLFKLLLINFEKGIRRESAASYIWPDLQYSRSSGNLNSIVHRLRKVFSSASVIIETNGFLRLNPDIVETDFQIFHSLYLQGMQYYKSKNFTEAQEIFTQTAEVYKGDFFEFDPNFEPSLEIRESFWIQYRELLHVQCSLFKKQNQYEKLTETARTLLLKDNLDESAWRYFMEGLYHLHQRNEAIAAFQELNSLLKEELNVEPEEETRILYEKIMNSDH